MDIERALREALRYETGIRDLYVEAGRKAIEDAAVRFFGSMGKDEQSHIDYLEYKLLRWKENGIISSEGLAVGKPDIGKLEEAARKAGSFLGGSGLGGHVEALSRALKSEEETTSFYGSLVGSLDGEAGKLFRRFLEIEEGHTRIVRAELDLVSKTGHWFDIREFDME